MQVSLTATGGLERRLEVAIPAAQVDGEVAQRLNKISRTARLKGFRPGKAPLAVIRQQYGEQVHGEVINDLMRASFSEAVAREKLNPAGGPRIEPIAMNPGADLKYAAVFEVLPEVKLAPISEINIERPVASVADKDLDAMIDTLRKQRPVFNEVARAAAATDRVTVDFTGKIDGVEFEGGSGDRRSHRHRREPGHEGIRRCAARRRCRRHARVQCDLSAPITRTRSSRARPPRST